MKLLSLSIDSPSTNEIINIQPPVGVPLGGLKNGFFNMVLGNGVVLLLTGASILALMFILWGAIGWILSGGDKTKIQAARNRIMYAIIGLIICLLAFTIVTFIGTIFKTRLL
jgi:hypothetical protein